MKKGILLFLIILLPIAADAFTGIVEINGIWYQVNTDSQEAEVFPRRDGKQYEGEIVIPTIVEYNLEPSPDLHCLMYAEEKK